MLKFGAWLKLVNPGSHFGFLSDSMAAAKGRQRGIRQIQSAGQEFFMDPDQIALAFVQLFQDLRPVWLGFLGTD